MARITAAKRKSDSSNFFTWKRLAIATSTLALCAVVALVAGLAGQPADSASSSGSGSSGSGSAASSGGNSGDSTRVSIGGGSAGSPGGVANRDPTLPGAVGEGDLPSNGAGYLTQADMEALLAQKLDAPMQAMIQQVQQLGNSLTESQTELAQSKSQVASLQRELNGTLSTIAALRRELAAKANSADVSALDTALDRKLQAKADADVVTSQLNAKADADAVTTLTSQLNAKADAEAVTTLTSQLQGKADSTAVQQLTTDVQAAGTRLQNTEAALGDLSDDLNADVAALRNDLNAINLDNPLIANASQEVSRLRYMLARIGQVSLVREERDEQRLRQTGNSGVHGARNGNTGSHPWHASSWTNSGGSMLSIHDHANIYDTVGMGEISASLNGVEFWTRHNDYRLRTPDPTSKSYKRLVNFDFPPVPPSVLSCADLACQVNEMRKYFDAWTKQDTDIADYKPYFKPVLCYLEGWWEVDANLEDPFSSDRHSLEADSWEELYMKYRYLTYLGRKNSRENLSFQPTRLWEMRDGVEPHVARWTYRIACQPLKDDVELKRLFVQPDLNVQMKRVQTRESLGDSRAARFGLNTYIGTRTWNIENHRYGGMAYQYIDTLMEQVSGLNNHGAGGQFPAINETIPDTETVNEIAYHYTDSKAGTSAPLDTTYYNRVFRVATNDAMGRATRQRSWNDATLWTAQTTQPRVAALNIPGIGDVRTTFAIPLELISVTPLSNWNPYNIPLNFNQYTAASAGGRNGDLTNPNKAYMGASRGVFYRTPSEFFNGLGTGADPADTSVSAAGVVTPDDPTTIRSCAASGHWVLFPKIPGVTQHFPYAGDRVRQRYPIAPVHVSAKYVWQEVKALQAIVSTGDSAQINAGLVVPALNKRTLRMAPSRSGGEHYHRLYLDNEDLEALNNNQQVTKTSSRGNMHTHELVIERGAGTDEFIVISCDGNTNPPTCSHDHPGLRME